MTPAKIHENCGHLARRSRDRLPVSGLHAGGSSLIDQTFPARSLRTQFAQKRHIL
jgi:hypothetical protein